MAPEGFDGVADAATDQFASRTIRAQRRPRG
jgi:hypothetical protein